MSKLLIVNADDFGLCRELSSGIIKAYEEGIVTSTTAVSTGSYLDEGIEFLKNSGIDAGVHLTFVGGEKPLTGHIDGLVDEKGCFLKDYSAVVPRILFNRFDREALRKELIAQTEKLKDSGLTVSHMDGHQHLHTLPAIRDMVFHIAERFNIKWIRIPESHKSGIKSMGLNFFSKGLKERAKKEGLRYADSFEGFDFSGKAHMENIRPVLNSLKAGITELMVHPGFDASSLFDWDFEWEAELEALTCGETKKILADKGITLTDYGSLS